MCFKNSSVCAINGCKNRKEQKPRKHIVLYRFPKVKELVKRWVNACNNKDLSNLLESQDGDYFYKKRYMICSSHFESKFFINKNLGKGLIKTAVPTKNLNVKRNIVTSVSESVVVDEIKVKIEMDGLCHGCLSAGRSTSPLGDLHNMFYALIGTTLMKDTAMCWECIALLKRLYTFKQKIKHAQHILSHAQDITSLSSLTCVYKDYYDCEVKSGDAISNEFKDIKEEISLSKIESIRTDSNKTEDHEYYNEFDDVDDKINESDQLLTNDITKNNHNSDAARKKLNSWRNIKQEYKSYAKHIRYKSWKKPYKQYFSEVMMDEEDVEVNFLRKDRQRQGHKMHLRCKICSLVYGRRIDLDRHNNLNHHKPNSPFKCLHCKEPQSSLESLKEHWRSHSVFYKCNACARAVFPCSLALHLSRSHVNVYECTNCTLSFSSLVAFSEHYNKSHPFVCDHCGKRCALRSVLEKHIKNHHTPQQCDACPRRFDNCKLYRVHCRALHPQLLQLGAQPDMCYCVECDAQYPSRALYMKHVNSKHAVRTTKVARTPCPECGKAFNKNSDMLLHYNFSHVKITKYHCDLCDKYFLKMYGLRTHMESVHLKLPKPKNKICDLCGRAFQSNSVLDNHRRTHTGERPFKCGVCPAAFAQKGAMKIHQRKQHAT